jgi:hypothetical protein
MHVADDRPKTRAQNSANRRVHDSKRETAWEVRTRAECDEQAPRNPERKDRREKHERSADTNTCDETQDDRGGNHGSVTISCGCREIPLPRSLAIGAALACSYSPDGSGGGERYSPRAAEFQRKPSEDRQVSVEPETLDQCLAIVSPISPSPLTRCGRGVLRSRALDRPAARACRCPR